MNVLKRDFYNPLVNFSFLNVSKMSESPQPTVGPFDAILSHMHGQGKVNYTQVFESISILAGEKDIPGPQVAAAKKVVLTHMETNFKLDSYLQHLTE